MNVKGNSKYKFLGYVGKIVVDTRFDECKIVVVRKASSLESITLRNRF